MRPAPCIQIIIQVSEEQLAFRGTLCDLEYVRVCIQISLELGSVLFHVLVEASSLQLLDSSIDVVLIGNHTDLNRVDGGDDLGLEVCQLALYVGSIKDEASSRRDDVVLRLIGHVIDVVVRSVGSISHVRQVACHPGIHGVQYIAVVALNLLDSVVAGLGVVRALNAIVEKVMVLFGSIQPVEELEAGFRILGSSGDSVQVLNIGVDPCPEHRRRKLQPT